MRKLLLAAALAFLPALGGCAEISKLQNAFTLVTGNVVSPQAVYIAINAFDSVKAGAKNYISLPRCGTGPVVCRDPAVTAKVITYINAGTTDRNQLKAALRANPSASISLVDVYNDLGSTTAALGALLVSK